MPDYSLSNIFIYPVKSLPGIKLNSSAVEERGLKHDRRWMLVDDNNIFMTQRNFQQFVFIQTRIENDNLIFSHRHKEIGQISISLHEFPSFQIKVQVWDDNCTVLVYEDKVNNWFSKAVGYKCKLAFMPDFSERKTSTDYFEESKNVSFADGYPYLIIGEESLDNLNSKLNSKVKMEQFRPNLVFNGGEPHDEDNWKTIRIGSLNFAVVKPCARCVITTVDLETGKKGKEPLSTLNKYRNYENKIMFGQNAIALQNGTVSINDEIKLMD